MFLVAFFFCKGQTVVVIHHEIHAYISYFICNLMNQMVSWTAMARLMEQCRASLG